MKNRAMTNKQKEEVMQRLLVIWKCVPNLRLGQLIVNCLPLEMKSNPFYIKDFDLVNRIEEYIKSGRVS